MLARYLKQVTRVDGMRISCRATLAKPLCLGPRNVKASHAGQASGSVRTVSGAGLHVELMQNELDLFRLRASFHRYVARSEFHSIFLEKGI